MYMKNKQRCAELSSNVLLYFFLSIMLYLFEWQMWGCIVLFIYFFVVDYATKLKFCMNLN